MFEMRNREEQMTRMDSFFKSITEYSLEALTEVLNNIYETGYHQYLYQTYSRLYIKYNKLSEVCFGCRGGLETSVALFSL